MRFRPETEALEFRDAPSSVAPSAAPVVLPPLVSGQLVLHRPNTPPSPVELWLSGTAPLPTADKLEPSLIGSDTKILGFDLTPKSLPAATPALSPAVDVPAVDEVFASFVLAKAA